MLAMWSKSKTDAILSVKSVKNSNKIYFAGIITICLCKLILIAALQIVAIPAHQEDEGLFVNLALNILNGQWLGPYNDMTLSKGPFFPLFLAANFLLGLPLKFTEHFLYLLSGVVLLYALSDLIKNRYILLTVFIIYAFNPVEASMNNLRILREGIYPSLTVLVLAGLIGIASSVEKSITRIVMWSLLAGVSLAAFWLTREEGVWIIPSVSILLLLSGWYVYKMRGNSFFLTRLIAAVLLPIIIFVLNITLIATINKMKYGIFAANELKQNSFKSAYGAFLRVNHQKSEIIMPERWKRVVSVPRSAREAVSRISPAFRDIHFDEVGDVWVGHSCRETTEPCADMSGAVFLWALRHAANNAGYHSDSIKADQYYRKLASEINSACDNKLLQCGPERSSLMPPLRREHFEVIPSAFIQGIKLLSTFADTRAGLPPSPLDSAGSLELFRNISRSIISPPTEKQVAIRGWVFRPGDEVVDVEILSDSNKKDAIERLEGEDVVKHHNDRSARGSRFEINATYHNTCKLVFSIKGQPLAEAMLNVKPLSFKIHDKKVLYVIDSISEKNINPLAYIDYVTIFRIDILNGIADFYSKYFRYFVIISSVCYLFALYMVMRRKITPLFFINSSILLAIIVRLLLLSLVAATSFGAMIVIYLSCVYPLVLMFACLTIIDVGLYFTKSNAETDKQAA